MNRAAYTLNEYILRCDEGLMLVDPAGLQPNSKKSKTSIRSLTQLFAPGSQKCKNQPRSPVPKELAGTYVQLQGGKAPNGRHDGCG